MSEENELPTVRVPIQLQSMLARPTSTKPVQITGVVKFEGINLGAGQSVKVMGPTQMYITGDIALGNSAAIEVDNKNPEAYLTLYLGGNMYCKNGGMINNLTEDPKKLKIYALDTCSTARSLPAVSIKAQQAISITMPRWRRRVPRSAERALP